MAERARTAFCTFRRQRRRTQDARGGAGGVVAGGVVSEGSGPDGRGSSARARREEMDRVAGRAGVRESSRPTSGSGSVGGPNWTQAPVTVTWPAHDSLLCAVAGRRHRRCYRRSCTAAAFQSLAVSAQWHLLGHVLNAQSLVWDQTTRYSTRQTAVSLSHTRACAISLISSRSWARLVFYERCLEHPAARAWERSTETSRARSESITDGT
jgi:hypothetical protein